MNEKHKLLDVRFNQIRAEHDASHVGYSESALFDLRDYALGLLADEPESRGVSRENRLRALGFDDAHVNCAANPGKCPKCWHVENLFDEDSESGE